MAKAYLIRKGYQEEFDRINLFARELGYSLDTNKLFIGDGEDNVHIPNEQFVANMVLVGVAKYGPVSGTTTELDSKHGNGTFAYDTDTQRVLYKSSAGAVSILARTSELPLGDATTIKLAVENIDAGDSNRVTLTDFNRPYRMLMLNGVMCTSHATDPHQYVYDATAKTVTIKECADGDIISYF